MNTGQVINSFSPSAKHWNFQSDRRILSTNNNGIKSTLSADQYEKSTQCGHFFQQLQYNYKKWVSASKCSDGTSINISSMTILIILIKNNGEKRI
jgi:hypothetical protein